MRRDIERTSPLDVRSLSRLYARLRSALDMIPCLLMRASSHHKPWYHIQLQASLQQTAFAYRTKKTPHILRSLFFDLMLKLFTKTELLDKFTITLDICLLKVLKKPTSLTYHL